ncbi:MAG: hypothetical protein A4E55_01367 [Pelotomaculum sp. PtaU1.Bin035]|nr:MAG: hypothetical protein A4E55_01367 [Pelotomaculum sp. PtaU1.Bin035]
MSFALNKKIIVPGFIVLLIITILFTFAGNKGDKIQELKVYGDHLLYANANELEEDADLIIVGHTQKDFKEFPATINYNNDGRYSDYYTVTDVRITKVIKGEYSKDTIPVTQRAALDKNKNILIINEDCTIMERGKPYLLFLKKIDLKDTYGIMSIDQGKFNIDNTDTKEKEIGQSNIQYKNLKEDVLEKFKQHI